MRGSFQDPRTLTSRYEICFQSLNVGDAIYEMDWVSLTVSTKRSLLMIMACTLKPIKFTSGGLITLNHDCFTRVSHQIT